MCTLKATNKDKTHKRGRSKRKMNRKMKIKMQTIRNIIEQTKKTTKIPMKRNKQIIDRERYRERERNTQ